jgi:hypothetical protein
MDNMKKIFTLLALLISVLTMSATDYTDTMTVSINNEVAAGQKATISLNQADGKYEFKLNNFALSMGGQLTPVGTIDLKNVEGSTVNGVTTLNANQKITIAAGDDPNVQWMGPLLGSVPVVLRAEQRNNSLYAVIDINILSLNIQVVFGTGGYQIPNSGFESYHTATLSSYESQEPDAWHSFMSADGIWAVAAGFSPYIAMSNNIRPGSIGKHSILIYSHDMSFTIANGTLTTGRLHAGSFTATDVANHTYLDMDSTAVDGNGDPFYTIMNGRPDSLDVWVKFKQGKFIAEHPYATVSAAITDGTYYQDPQDKEYTNVLATAKNNKIESKNFVWQHLSIPFNYVDNKVNGKAILVTISTNADAGYGSTDTLYVDDANLVYNGGLKSATFSGVTVNAEDSISENTYNVSAFSDFNPNQISVQCNGAGATSIKTLSDDNKTATITIISGDLKYADTYTFYATGTVSGISTVSTSSNDKITDIYNLNGQKVSKMFPGQVYVVHYASGKTVKLIK